MGSRLRRAVEKLLVPWYDRAQAEAESAEAERKARHTEELHQRAIRARIEAERVSRLYRDRLVGRR